MKEHKFKVGDWIVYDSSIESLETPPFLIYSINEINETDQCYIIRSSHDPISTGFYLRFEDEDTFKKYNELDIIIKAINKELDEI